MTNIKSIFVMFMVSKICVQWEGGFGGGGGDDIHPHIGTGKYLMFSGWKGSVTHDWFHSYPN